MKIGILTFHSQLNYGGVLQAYALQETLKELGHSVIIIDRWLTPDNGTLLGILNSKSLLAWIKLIGRGILGYGDLRDLMRRIKTRRFIMQHLNLSSYHFYQWPEAPDDLDVDCIVVGSDQVWSTPSLVPSAAYLLEGMKSKITAISYAASFGPTSINAEQREKYIAGLKRFKAISVREHEGVNIVNSFGYHAVQVVDPVILSQTNIWEKFSKPRASSRPKLVCYFLSQSYDDCLPLLEKFARGTNADVYAFAINECIVLPKRFMDALKISKYALRRLFSRIHFMSTSSPDEFVGAIKTADWFLTDSFHGLAFSAKFNLNVRVLKPSTAFRASMFSRISEFVCAYSKGNVLVDNVSAALESFLNKETVSFDTSKISTDAKDSLAWLEKSFH